MKYLRVKTDVYNEACKEERELVFKDKDTLLATVRYGESKSYVWATRFTTGSWHISIGGLSLEGITEETMLELLKAINKESEKHSVTSNDNA